MTSLWKVEFHCHTVYSRDSLNWIPTLIRTAYKNGLNKVMITDHNTIRGAKEACLAAPDLFVMGEEIKLNNGAEILAYFVREEVPAKLPYLEVIQRLRDQGAVIALPHPMDRYRGKWQYEDLEKVISLVDVVEGFNARCMVNYDNQLAESLAKKYEKLAFSGSDAHFPGEVGMAPTILPPFSNAEELIESLQQATLVRRQSSNLVHFGSRYAVFYKRLFRNSRRVQEITKKLNLPDNE